MNATRKRRNLQPATGSCRWIVQPGIGRCSHPGCLVITAKRCNGAEVTEPYTVTENRQEGNLLGYRLAKQDGTVYDVPAGLNDCTCPDFVYGRAQAQTAELRLCKHCRALRQALATLDR